MDAKGEADTVLTYGFAGFRLSTRRQCLHYGDEEFALSTKLYYLLLAFLERPGEVLTKDDITRAAWPNQVVTDAAIAKQVQRLRLLLVDTGRDTPLIETHRGVGYRLTCNVTPDYVASASETARQYRRRWPQLVATTLLLLGVSTWLVVDSRGNRTVIGNDVAPTLAMQPVVGDAAALTEGVAEYLAARLGPSTDIAPMVSLEGEPVSGTDLSGLRLAKVRIGPVAAFHLARQGATYQLTLSFRDGERSRQEQLAGDSITALLDDAVRWVGTQAGSLPSAPAPAASYALASYFEGLAATGSGGACGRAMEYYQAAIAANPEFHRARLRLARCARALGRPHEAAAAAVALLAREGHTVPALLLDAGLVAAGAYLDLGNTDAAGAILKGLPLKALQESAPLGQLQTLAALALMARLEGDLSAAEAHLLDRLELARTHYPMPLYLADIHLALADSYQAAGQHDALLAHARQARTLAEETGDIDTLMESYRYLAASYFRNGDTDAAVQLALAAAPIIDQARDVASKAYFLQFSAMSLNLRGHFSPARDYTTALRALGETSADPMYGAIADFTVMHRLYVQGAFTEAYRLASSTRSRLESSAGLHAAVPAALAFEAIAASRGASLDTAGSLIRLLETRYPDDMSLPAPILRARGHVALRNKQFTRGLQFLREAEAAYRQAGMRAVGNYVGYEIIESRLAGEAEPPWDDIQRLSALTDFDYPLARLQAQAHAKESNYLGATAALEEARLRGNDLWSDRDQLILEEYRSVLAMADVPNSLGSGPDGT